MRTPVLPALGKGIASFFHPKMLALLVVPLFVAIGAWVIGEACRQARAWQDAGLPPFVVAVNLSAVQFKRPDLVNTVINALVLSDLDSQWLELELTESILIQDAEATLDAVRRLKLVPRSRYDDAAAFFG